MSLTDWFIFSMGVRKCCPFLPHVFVLVLKVLIRLLKEQKEAAWLVLELITIEIWSLIFLM